MQLDVTKQGQALVIRIEAERIDAAVAIDFKESVRQASEGGGDPVILDLSAVQFLDSSGLGALVAVMKLLAPDRRLELAGLSAPVARVFRLTRMETIFTIHDKVPSVPLQRAI